MADTVYIVVGRMIRISSMPNCCGSEVRRRRRLSPSWRELARKILNLLEDS